MQRKLSEDMFQKVLAEVKENHELLKLCSDAKKQQLKPMMRNFYKSAKNVLQENHY